jgi:hypothetical protein
MQKTFLFLFSLALFFLLSCETYAGNSQSFEQDTADTLLYRVTTRDGNVFIGQILSRTEEVLVISTEQFGQVTVRQQNIRSIQPVRGEQIREIVIWFENPQESRYFWSPSGYGLKKGEGYYQNVWVLFNQINYGATDHFSVGVGMLPLFLFAGAPTPVWVTTKFSAPVVPNQWNVGGGVLAGAVLGAGEAAYGIAYGISTFGSRDRNVSVGIGYGFTGDGWGRRPTFNLSTLLRYSERSYFISENYLIDRDVLISLGGRTVVRSVSIDYGLVMPMIADEFIAIPWLGVVIPF